jgi:hypothetical protein
MSVTSTITVQNKKYEYTLKSAKEKGVIRFVCPGANIDQDFLAEDIPALILDLPAFIIAERNYQDNQAEVVCFRISSDKTIAHFTKKVNYLAKLGCKKLEFLYNTRASGMGRIWT